MIYLLLLLTVGWDEPTTREELPSADAQAISEMAEMWLEQPGDMIDITTAGKRYVVVWPYAKAECGSQEMLDDLCNSVGRRTSGVGVDRCAEGRFGSRMWAIGGRSGCTCTDGTSIALKCN